MKLYKFLNMYFLLSMACYEQVGELVTAYCQFEHTVLAGPTLQDSHVTKILL